MKKIMIIFLTALLLVLLSGCGKKEEFTMTRKEQVKRHLKDIKGAYSSIQSDFPSLKAPDYFPEDEILMLTAHIEGKERHKKADLEDAILAIGNYIENAKEIIERYQDYDHHMKVKWPEITQDVDEYIENILMITP